MEMLLEDFDTIRGKLEVIARDLGTSLGGASFQITDRGLTVYLNGGFTLSFEGGNFLTRVYQHGQQIWSNALGGPSFADFCVERVMNSVRSPE